MKKVYENTCDERRESAVAMEICKQWKCDSTRLGDSDKTTYQLSRGSKVVALCETQCLEIASSDYPTFMIPYKNIKQLRSIAQNQHVPAFIVVHYKEDIRYFSVEETPDWLEEGSRDITEVAHYETKRLKSIYPV
jgi:hypothetical protein